MILKQHRTKRKYFLAAFGIFYFFILSLFFMPYVSGEVVVFDDYQTRISFHDEQLTIERNIILKNVGSNPIIPGELHFKLHEIKKGKKIPIDVYDFKVTNYYNKELKSRIVKGNQETDLVVSIWEPVLPKFTYKINIQYSINFEPKGILFHEIKIPMEETTIPIRSSTQQLLLDKKYHITYAPEAKLSLVSIDGKEKRKIEWQDKKNMIVEYSLLPLPKLGIRAVNIFWGIMILALLLSTYFIHKRMKR